MVGSKGLSAASVKQQANVVEDFLQQAAVLKRVLREAMAGRKDLVEEAAFGAPGASFGTPGAGCEWRAPPPLRLGLWTPTAAPWACTAIGRAPLGAARAGGGAGLGQASGPVSAPVS